jgi:hypothetical protein
VEGDRDHMDYRQGTAHQRRHIRIRQEFPTAGLGDPRKPNRHCGRLGNPYNEARTSRPITRLRCYRGSAQTSPPVSVRNLLSRHQCGENAGSSTVVNDAEPLSTATQAAATSAHRVLDFDRNRSRLRSPEHVAGRLRTPRSRRACRSNSGNN